MTRFENLLEAVPDALVGMDQKGVIRFVNRQTESLFGYDRDDLIGEHIEKLVPEPLWQIYASHRNSYFADPRTRSSGLEVELSGRHRDGSTFPVNISLSHIDTGDVLLVVTSVVDVARRRSAVKHVELISAIVEYSDDAIIGSTLEGVITSWNPAAEKMYGYSSREIIGRSGSILTPEDQQDTIEANLDRLKDDQHVRAFETMRVRKDGSVVPVSVTVAPIHDEDGAIVGASAVHRDITEQRRAYEVAQRMEAIVASTDDAIIGQTLKGTVSSWNPAAERMYGYKSEEIIGKSVGLLIPEDRAGELFANMDRLKDGKRIRRLETTRVRKGGTVFPASVTISPIHDKNGKIVGASAIHRDVTEQRRAFEVAQRMEAIVESSDDAIIGKTPEGIITSWNPAAERLYGYTSQEVIGQPISILMPEDRRDEMESILARIRAGHHVERIDTVWVRKDGSVLRVALLVSPIRDADGAIVGASAIARDVTEARRAFEVAQRMEAIVASSEDAIIGQTLQGVVTTWNPAAVRLYGYTSQEIVGQPISILMPEDRRDEMEANLARIRAGRRVETHETIRVRKDGTRFPISLTLSPICDKEGVIVGASGIGRDLSEQEHLARYARSLLEASQDPMITISPEGRIDDVNEATVKITGVPRDELIGSECAQYMADADKAREYIQQAFEHGSATDVPQTVCHRDGTLTDVRCNASVYRDAGGNVLGVLSTGHDVTRQKEAFVAAQRMAAIVRSSDDAIISGTLEGIITSWNPAAERMYGYSAKEMVGQSGNLLPPADAATVVHDVLAEIKAGQEVVHVQTRRRRKDGAVFPVSVTTSAIRDADGTIVGVCAIARDMAESEHAAEYARSLIEAAMDPLVTISPEGRINDVNEATVKVTGVPRGRLVGTDFAGYFTDPDKAHEGYQRVFAQGSVTDYPLTLRHQDGTLTDVLYNASVYRDSGGNVLGVLAAARDMTNQKEAFEAAQRMAAIVEHSDDAIIGSTLNGIVTSWNPAAERLYGYSGDRISGRSVDLLSPEDRAGEIRAVLAKISEGRPVNNFETICTRKDRSTFPVKLTVAPIRDAHGAVVGASAIARDVTEQRRALWAGQQMAAIVRGSDDAIIGRTLEGAITSWNPAAERMFGYSSSEIVGKSIELLTPPDRAGEARTVLAKISKGQPVEHLETNRVRKDGTVFPVSLTVSPIRDEVDAVSGASVIARDMTEQRRAAAVTRMAAAIEFSGEAIIATTLEGVITSWNPAAAAMFGYSSREMIGKSETLLLPGGRTREISDVLARVRVGERVLDYETIRARKDGTVFPVSLTMTPICDAYGEVVGASSTPRDITKQKEAVAAAEHLAAIVEFSADAIISYSLDGVVTSWNPAAEAMFGYPSREIIGRSIEQLSPQGRTGQTSSILAMVKAGRHVEHHETMRLRKDGTAIRVSLTVSPIRGAEGLVGLSAIARDMTPV